MHRILRGCNCEITYSVQVSCCDSQNMHKIKYKKALTKEIKEKSPRFIPKIMLTT